MAQLAPQSRAFPEVDYSAKIPFDQWPDTLELARLQAISDNLPEGEVVGAVLSWPVADGAAYYVVTKEKPLTLQHLAYGDAWHIQYVLIRGLRKQDVLDQLARQRRFRAAFSK